MALLQGEPTHLRARPPQIQTPGPALTVCVLLSNSLHLEVRVPLFNEVE